jgi:hypothetical protein
MAVKTYRIAVDSEKDPDVYDAIEEKSKALRGDFIREAVRYFLKNKTRYFEGRSAEHIAAKEAKKGPPVPAKDFLQVG